MYIYFEGLPEEQLVKLRRKGSEKASKGGY